MLEVLDFGVTRVPLVTKGLEPTGRFKNMETSKEAVIREDTGEILGIVGKDYKLIHHKEAITNFIGSLVDISNFEITAISLPKSGARMIARVQFPDIPVEIGNGDILYPEIIVRNSMDGLERFSVRIGASRKSDGTVFLAGKKLNTRSRKHTV